MVDRRVYNHREYFSNISIKFKENFNKKRRSYEEDLVKFWKKFKKNLEEI